MNINVSSHTEISQYSLTINSNNIKQFLLYIYIYIYIYTLLLLLLYVMLIFKRDGRELICNFVYLERQQCCTKKAYRPVVINSG